MRKSSMDVNCVFGFSTSIIFRCRVFYVLFSNIHAVDFFRPLFSLYAIHFIQTEYQSLECVIFNKTKIDDIEYRQHVLVYPAFSVFVIGVVGFICFLSPRSLFHLFVIAVQLYTCFIKFIENAPDWHAQNACRVCRIHLHHIQ